LGFARESRSAELASLPETGIPIMFLGFDSSTQSLTAVIIDPTAGKIVHERSVHFGQDLPHYQCPNGFLPGGIKGEVHANPLMWIEALDLLCARLHESMDLSDIRVIAGSGQQHGSIYLDASFDERLASLNNSQSLVRQLSPALTRVTSPIWMDTSTGSQCREIAAALGGDAELCRRTGSTAIERFTGPQIRRFYQIDPLAYSHTSRIHLVSSFIASILAGKSVPADFGDAAGMNLLNLTTGKWDPDLLEATAPDLADKLLQPVAATSIQGTISPYFVEKYGFSAECRTALFTGDNPASLVGMGATAPGNVVISLGTSDTLFAAMPEPRTDPNGFGHVFGNPAGGFMSIIVFRNGSLAREALRDSLELDWSAFESEALAATKASAGMNLMLPFFGPEITPRFDFSEPFMDFQEEPEPALEVRALLEGQFLNMRLHSEWMEVKPERILLTGGASKNNGIASIAADVFQARVERLDVSNSAALGAALIAAAADGHDLAELQKTFCKTSGAIEPDREMEDLYEDALDDFSELLDEVLG
jgi:xylulokinase